MNIVKSIFSYKRSRTWFIISCAVLVLLIAVSIVANVILPGLMDTLFGGERSERIAGTGDNVYYKLDEGITDKASSKANAERVNELICEEGMILLKNDNNTLPVTTSQSKKAKVSVFGKNSVNPAYVGSGSVGSGVSDPVSIFDSLESAGFEYNPVLKAFYEDTSKSGSKRPDSPSLNNTSAAIGFETGETPVTSYGSDVIDSLDNYNELGLCVITRISGENNDSPTTMIDTNGAYDDNDHYFELDKNEQEMIKLACENCSKVVLLVNAGTSFELGFLYGDESDSTLIDYDFSSKVGACIQMGYPGEKGMYALGKILSGEVNPSGHTVETYATDFLSMPSVENFSAKGVSNIDNYYVDGTKELQWFIDYEEGIYVGYRYYETRGAADSEWYKNNVVYPFGYGLSYTTFTKTIKSSNISQTSNWKADDKLEVSVEVKNTGAVAGKDVVQIYVEAPYVSGGIEKSSKVLVAFAKTGLIQPGETETVKLSFTPYDFASYDYLDKNGNGFKGYEIESGKYIIDISSDAHTVDDSVETTLAAGIKVEKDTETDYEVTNRFDEMDDQLGSVLSRNDWENTYPQMRTSAEKQVSSDFISDLETNHDSGNPLTADSEVVKAAAEKYPAAKKKDKNSPKLYEYIGLNADDEKWDELVSCLTFSTLWDEVSGCAFTTPAIDYISKPKTIETDGPAGFTKFMGKTDIIFDTCVYACEPVIAATWNTELANNMGTALGNEALIGNTNTGETYSGWYGPACNIHRTPFGGRNPEYYSEDGLLSGIMASAVIQGCQSKGVYCYLKHFVANEQETHRGGVCTWLTEQSLRELYLKPFEIVVKDGGLAIMSSFNRIGTKWTGGYYPLVTEVLRNEWGFNGTVLCDFASGQAHMDIKQQTYAGGDAWLDTITPTNNFSKDNALDVYMLQQSVKHILYTCANSNAMNGLGDGSKYITKMAYWRIILIVLDVVIPVVVVALGVLMLIKNKKDITRVK